MSPVNPGVPDENWGIKMSLKEPVSLMDPGVPDEHAFLEDPRVLMNSVSLVSQGVPRGLHVPH